MVPEGNVSKMFAQSDFVTLMSVSFRLFEFLEGLPRLAVRAVEFSSLVPAAKRAANLAVFKTGQSQVTTYVWGNRNLLGFRFQDFASVQIDCCSSV